MIKKLMHLRQHMDIGTLLFTVVLYQLLCVFYLNTLQIILVDYAVIDMGFLYDYSDAAPCAKIMRVNSITTFLLHVSQCITFNQIKFSTATLIVEARLN